MKSAYQHYRRQAAVIVGLVFLVSGILKVSDPVGTGLIVAEYFKFLRLAFLVPLARAVGVAFSVAECAVGIGLVTGVMRRLMAWATFVLLGFFTLLTLILWIFNPPMDCGCFGEAFHLTHAQSFWKNVVLLAVSAIAFTPFRDFGEPAPRKWVGATLCTAAVLLASVYSNRHLPIVDFTAFNWGAQLFASLDDSADESDFRRAPMLSFRDAEGEYLDDYAADGKVVIFSVTNPGRARWEDLSVQCHQVEQAGALPLVLVSSYPEEMDRYAVPADLPLYYSDYKTLITLNRSNGGGAYFYAGELVHKWAFRDFPQTLPADLSEDPVALSSRHITRRRLTAQSFCVFVAAVLLLM